MRNYDYEGLGPGKCGQNRTIATCRPALFTLLKQNTMMRIPVCFLDSGGDKGNDPQKMSGIVLKHFDLPGLTIPKLSGGENK